jgi:NAD+ diphosphatase
MAAQTPETRWTVFKTGEPLVTRPPNGRAKALALLKTSHVKHLLGEEPFFGQGQLPGQSVTSDASVLEACRLRGLPIVFLGLKEPEGTQALPSSEFRTPETASDISGAPYFAIDITGVPETVTDELLISAAEGGETLKFDEPRSATASFGMFDGATFAVARSMLDWKIRNKVISPTLMRNYYSITEHASSAPGAVRPRTRCGEVGNFLACPFCLGRTMKAKTRVQQGGMVSLHVWPQTYDILMLRKGLQNFMHPRTDAVVIMAVIDETGDRILLGRNVSQP